MPDITKIVGEAGDNQTQDTALVQAMLRIVKNVNQAPYLAGNYDGAYGPVTKAAIVAFQADQKLIQPSGKDNQGLVAPDGETIQKLNAMLPATHNELRIIPSTKTVYLEGSADDAAASKAAITGDAEFETNFRTLVGRLVQTMYDQHKIVLWLTPTGSRRTFAQQAAEVNTNAGPGESNHNFGREVDIQGLACQRVAWVWTPPVNAIRHFPDDARDFGFGPSSGQP